MNKILGVSLELLSKLGLLNAHFEGRRKLTRETGHEGICLFFLLTLVYIAVGLFKGTPL